jgi:purine nucleosidase
VWYHHVKQAPYLKEYPASRKYEAGQAVALMQETIRNHPNEVTLLCVGPLTNAAALWVADPKTFGLLKEIVWMGGFYRVDREEPRYEANCMLDAIAAGTILEQVNVPIRIAGLEETRVLGANITQVEQWFSGSKFKPLLDFFQGTHWADQKPRWLGMHDPLAASIIFNEGLCDYKTGRIKVHLAAYVIPKKQDVATNEVSGYTTFLPDENGPHRIVRNAGKSALHDHLAATWKRFKDHDP